MYPILRHCKGGRQIIVRISWFQIARALKGSMQGASIHGAAVLDSESRQDFGYSLLTRHGKTWNLTLKNRVRGVLANCTIPTGRANCVARASD